MEYDVTFLKELRGLGDYMKELCVEDVITDTVNRCIEIKRTLNRLEKRQKSGSSNNNSTERKKNSLLQEYKILCSCGTEQLLKVKDFALYIRYFLESMEMDYKKTMAQA